jgi:hypothetical protein
MRTRIYKLDSFTMKLFYSRRGAARGLSDGATMQAIAAENFFNSRLGCNEYTQPSLLCHVRFKQMG